MKRYNLEFKEKALALSKQIGNVAAAKELGCSPAVISLWKQHRNKLEARVANKKPTTRISIDLEDEGLNVLAKLIASDKKLNQIRALLVEA